MKRSSGTARHYPRTARLNQLVHEIVAEEIERLDEVVRAELREADLGLGAGAPGRGGAQVQDLGGGVEQVQVAGLGAEQPPGIPLAPERS